MRSRLFLLALILAQPLRADELAPIHGDPSTGIAAAFGALEQGSFLGALDAAERSGPVARDIIAWLRLREGQGRFDDALDFLRRNPEWPGLDLLRRRMEADLPTAFTSDERAQDVVDFFGAETPTSGQGTVALVRAYRKLGRDGDAHALAALAWVERSLTPAAEDTLLALFPEDLVALNATRAEQMYWDESDQALSRAMRRGLPGELQERIKARRAARAGSVPKDLPKELRDDPGIAHEQFRRAIKGKRRDDAADILLRQSVSAEALGRPSAWARERRDLVRRAMQAGDHERAYAMASTHWLSPDTGYDYSDLEWLSGFLALRFLDQPEQALAHFRKFTSSVETPISLGRAGYWLGRAHAALGHDDYARKAYAFGARYQTSFYGLLAAEALGLPLDPSLAGRESFPPFHEAPFRGSSVLEAALLLQAAGQRDLSERFFVHLADSLDRPSIGTLTQLVLDLGEPHIALLIAKQAARKGLTLPRSYYPVVEVGVQNNPVEAALALSIARRESEFDPGVSSGVGARGLMQLMPGTAREVAGALNLPYSAQRLFSDPSYNATLGTAYLAGLIDRFGDNPVLVSSGYNAGPGRPAQWIKANGDPRDRDVDVIDWIEMIPFDETRNYAMRVAESIPVYRARLGDQTAALNFTQLLKGR
ncbi:lytic transglycosylase domain-containing protein [Maribius pontilimi]|uniref:Lytic transglycosylase domain-containing protein n=1 Tax=Palleronia pontilimi TaxID=1964209 RepID=A0A934IBY1_9RHOB|nr:lytic transglycosylase domain-containing protein [Palleronia pontilimi]MBJ3761647.1 lytic transglycosylase domain-containing protein [Palleronia pontilimi]